MVRVLLPSAAVVRQYGSEVLQRVLRRADPLSPVAAGRTGALQRCFETTPQRPFASAAVRRQAARGDAGTALWVAADPVQVQADMSSLRLMAVGEFSLTPAEIESLLRALKPVCGDLGFELTAVDSDHWYLRGLTSADVPLEGDPRDLLGADLAAHLPASAKWRRLLNETQVLLHQHPLQRERAARGLPTPNSLWFWGGGALPHAVKSGFARVVTDDALLRAWAAQVGARATATADADAPPATGKVPAGSRLIECWSPHGLQALQDRLLPAMLRDLRSRRIAAIELECLSGERHRYVHWHGWRVWRR
jgi:hypothetical protein